MKLRCPKCATTGDVLLFVEAEQTRQTLMRLLARTPIGLLVLRYVDLHKPATRDMSPDRWNKLAVDVMDLVEQGSLPYQGRQAPAPLEAWQYAVDEAYKQRDSGKLQLPLSGHGWITAVIAAYKPPVVETTMTPAPSEPVPSVRITPSDDRPRWEQQGFKGAKK